LLHGVNIACVYSARKHTCKTLPFNACLQVTQRILVATALIVAGCIILVSFGNHTSETYTSQQLQAFYHA
jgi:hypothetical protein